MKLYIMRHGQTDWNVKKKIQGCTDIELNEVGLEQARNAKEEFEKYPIDMIFCSPLKRTKKTAEIINEDKKVPVIYEERLLERYYGELEGMNPEEHEEMFSAFWNYNLNKSDYSVEAIKNLCGRVWGFLEEVKENYQEKMFYW